MVRTRAAVAICVIWGCAAGAPGLTLPEKLIAAGHWKQARTLVEARIREAPDDALANFLLSQVRNAFGDRESPLSLAEKAVALDGNTAKYHRQVAEVIGVMAQHAGLFQQLGLARRFRKEIDTAVALDPRDLQALRDLMEFYLLAPGIAGGDSHKAETVAERIAGISPADGFLARSRLAGYRKRATDAEAFLRSAVEAQPAYYNARIQLAQFYLADGHLNLAAAEQNACEARKIDPGRVDAYSILASVYAARAQWNELESTLTSVLQEVPDDRTPYFRATERLLASGRDLPRAERYLRIYLDQPPEGNQPTAGDARSQLDVILQREGRAAESSK